MMVDSLFPSGAAQVRAMPYLGRAYMPAIIWSIIWAVILGIITYAVGEVIVKAVRSLLNYADNPLPSSSLVLNCIRGVVWAFGGSFILEQCFGIDASAIVTALGIGGVALSLGLQDTLSNFIGGIVITFMHIVEPGDNIEVGDETGVVQDVTWRHTTIKDSMGQEIILPNSTISSSTVTHLLPANRVVVPFAIPRPSQETNAGDADTIDELTDRISASAMAAANEVSPVVGEPLILLSEITTFGINGNIILTVEDADKTAFAADAVVRAIARDLQ